MTPVTETPADTDSIALADLEAAACLLSRFLRSSDPARYVADDALSLVGLFTRVERTGLAGKTLFAKRVSQAKLHVRSGHRNAAELLSSTTGDGLAETKDQLSLADNLEDQPKLRDAFVEGRLSRRRVSLVSNAAKVNPAKEQELVDYGQSDSEGELKERCLRAKVAGRSTEDQRRHARRLHEQRRCRTFTDEEGAFGLTASLAPETGARVRAALDEATDRIFHESRRAGRRESHEAYRADALVELLVGRHLHCATAAAGAPAGIAATARAPGSDAPGGAAAAGTRRDRLVVRVDLAALRRGVTEGAECCEVPGVGPVPVEVARRVLGESLTHLLVSDGVDVTTVTSLGRHVPAAVKVALLERDPRCVVPGCGARLGLEDDHWVTDFAKGGPTSYDNLARVCGHHHKLKTHQGFTLTGGPGNWQWSPPDASGPPSRRRPRPTHRAPPGTDEPSFF